MTWPPELPFLDVLEKARAYDQTSIGMLYRRFLPAVYRYVLGRTGDVHSSEDVTADTFLAMVESVSATRAQDELTFAAWLLGIARNKVAMYFRKRRGNMDVQVEWSEDDQPATGADEGDPLRIIAARESWHEVVAAMQKLTEEQRTVILYRCVLGYPAEDVGKLMDKQPGTVRALQFRALSSLSRQLKKNPDLSHHDDRRQSDATRR